MDEFGVLTERYGLKPQGKSAPMASARRPNDAAVNSSSSTYKSSSSAYNSGSVNGSFFNDQDSFLNTQKTSNSGGFSGDGFDVFGDFQRNSKQTSKSSNGSSFDYDSIFATSGFSKSTTSFDDGMFGGLSSSGSNRNGVNTGADDIFGSVSSNKNEQNGGSADLLGDFGSKPKATSQNGSVGFDDLIPGFSSNSLSGRSHNNGTTKSSFNSSDDPFGVFESSSSTRTNSTFIDPLEEISKLGQSGSSKSTASSTFSSPLSPPPKPGQVLKADKVKNPNVSSIDELEAFAMGKSTNNADARSNARNVKEVRNTQATKSSKYREAEDGAWQSQQKSPDDLESFFSMGSRSSSAPKSRATDPDPVFEANLRDRRKPEVTQRKSSGASSGIKKASSATNMVTDLSSIFGDASFFGGEFEEVDGESEERRRARLGRHQRTQERMARAVADMNQRDHQSQNEQEERRRIADQMDVDIKRWAAGKEGNMRALLSSLQYVLWPECGWEPVSLTDLITSSSVKKVYRKATLCVHPDKVQQKGATLQQKYTAEKVFDILKEAWNKFNKEELS